MLLDNKFSIIINWKMLNKHIIEYIESNSGQKEKIKKALNNLVHVPYILNVFPKTFDYELFKFH